MVGAIGSHEGALATVEASISATGLRRREQGDDQGQSEGPSQHLSQRSSDARVDRKRGRASHPAIIHTRNIRGKAAALRLWRLGDDIPKTPPLPVIDAERTAEPLAVDHFTRR
jgi:hypothetical protein